MEGLKVFISSLIVRMALPAVTSAIKEIVKAPEIDKRRIQLIEFVDRMTGKTETKLDDILLGNLVRMALSPEMIVEWGTFLISLATSWLISNRDNIYAGAAIDMLNYMQEQLKELSSMSESTLNDPAQLVSLAAAAFQPVGEP